MFIAIVLRQQTNLRRVRCPFLHFSITQSDLHFAGRLILWVKKCLVGIPPVLLHHGLNHLLKGACLISTLTSHRLFVREDSDSELSILLHGIIDGHVQTAEHDSEETSSARTSDHVEEFAWFGSDSEVVLALDLEHGLFEDK